MTVRQALYAGPRFGFVLMTIFGCIGLILVTVGAYSEVLRLVIRTGLRLVAAGMAIGVAMSFVLGRLIGTQFVDVTPHDPACTFLRLAEYRGPVPSGCSQSLNPWS